MSLCFYVFIENVLGYIPKKNSEYFTFTGNLKIIHGFKYDFLLLFVAEYLKKGFGQGNSIITTDAEQLQKIT